MSASAEKRVVISTGVVTPFFDFGAGHTVTGSQVNGNRLIAVVDDQLKIVDIAASAIASLDNQFYNGPALSPDGKLLVAQSAGDLWLFKLP